VLLLSEAKVRSARQRLAERRKMMQAWANYLDGLKAGEGGKFQRV
jgi:hypothetical protein